MKKMLIWSSENEFDEDFREELVLTQKEAFGEDYEPSDEEIDEDLAELNGIYLEDERRNLDVNVDGVIIAFADLGLWKGRRKGYKIYKSNISDILYSECDGAEWYGDGYNIRGDFSHHDGRNHVLYRVAKDMNDAERIAAKIYNGEMDEEQFRRRTRSLYPYVAKVYGWKIRWRKKV